MMEPIRRVVSPPRKFFLLLILYPWKTSGGGSAFVGWEGATYDAKRTWGTVSNPVKNAEIVEEVQQEDFVAPETKNQAPSDVHWIEQLSWEPRSYLFHGFLSDEECDYIIKKARPFIKRSTVVGDTGSEVHSVRTSLGMFLTRKTDPKIEGIRERVAHWAQIPSVNQEDLQVLRYGFDQKYGQHMDVLENEDPRVATVLLYLSDVEEGGETAFPNSWNWLDLKQQERHGPFSECAEGHVAVKAKKGDALMFFSMTPDGKLDETSLHAGCPVHRGVKWTATVWIHGVPFRPNELEIAFPTDRPDPGNCYNIDKSCKEWAANGECKRNPNFMLEVCGESCGSCEKCKDTDQECIDRNRERLGYPKLSEVY